MMRGFTKCIATFFACVFFVSCSHYLSGFFIREVNAISNESNNREWTIMMYMAADNDLESEAIHDINELEIFDFANKNISVLSLLDRSAAHDETNGAWDDTRLFEITKDTQGENGIITSKELSSKELALDVGIETELDMARSSTLENFLRFCYSNYKAEHYALIVWGHGNGWRSVTSDNHTKSTMKLPEFRQAIETIFKTQSLDVIAFDASFGATMETLWEIKEVSKYFIGTPGSMNAFGWDYKEVFSYFISSKLTIDDFLYAFKLQQKTSIIDLNQMDELKNQFDELSFLVASQINSSDKQQKMKNLLLYDVSSYKASSYPSDMFLDVHEYASMILKNIELITNDKTIQLEVRDASVLLQELLSNLIHLDEGKENAISVFIIPFTDERIPDAVFPQSYIKDATSEIKIKFVHESIGWVPTNNESVTLLNKLFFATF